uniref:Uncharacterized protein n=1 Tax=Medicago truncatula TaxID=3880 RepID=Q2HRW1_MEDTR|nr:hypothetical protein MtrDRAFT_AC157890g34v2 [Medicago truncatula]
MKLSRCCCRATQGSAAERVTGLRNGQRNTVISLKTERSRLADARVQAREPRQD